MPSLSSDKILLLIGASRGLGFALAEEYLKRGWHVVATERSSTQSQLHNLLEASYGRLEIEIVSLQRPDRLGRHRIRAHRCRPLASRTPCPRNHADDQRRLAILRGRRLQPN